jgi:hypothetical protein
VLGIFPAQARRSLKIQFTDSYGLNREPRQFEASLRPSFLERSHSRLGVSL